MPEASLRQPIDINATFDKFENDYLKFEDIKCGESKRPDICAFLLLDKLLPGKRDIIASAEHDEICLDVDVEQLSMVATEDDIQNLVRCGVRLDEESGSLAMFV